MRFVMLAVLALPFVSDVSQPVGWGTVSVSEWDALREAGWQGIPGDGREALYAPAAL